MSPAERAAWRAKAAEAGVPLSDTAAAGDGPDADLDRTGPGRRSGSAAARSARIGNNLNQIARWANIHASAVEAVTVIANLVAFERSLLALARLDGDDGDAH